MRVISQNGMIDFPYEQIVVCMDGNNVIARFVGIEKSNLLGTYSTEERAQEVMEMLRENYIGIDESSYRDEYGGVLHHHRKEEETKIFQFPKDEDVEV